MIVIISQIIYTLDPNIPSSIYCISVGEYEDWYFKISIATPGNVEKLTTKLYNARGGLIEEIRSDISDTTSLIITSSYEDLPAGVFSRPSVALIRVFHREDDYKPVRIDFRGRA